VSFSGHGWTSGKASDTTGGSAATATVSSLSTPTASRKAAPIVQTVTGTNYVAGSIIYANYAPVATVYVDATHVRCDKFNPMPDNGQAGTIPVGVRNPGQALSATTNFTAT
jgi:hypothetical protein